MLDHLTIHCYHITIVVSLSFKKLFVPRSRFDISSGFPSMSAVSKTREILSDEYESIPYAVTAVRYPPRQ